MSISFLSRTYVWIALLCLLLPGCGPSQADVEREVAKQLLLTESENAVLAMDRWKSVVPTDLAQLQPSAEPLTSSEYFFVIEGNLSTDPRTEEGFRRQGKPALTAIIHEADLSRLLGANSADTSLPKLESDRFLEAPPFFSANAQTIRNLPASTELAESIADDSLLNYCRLMQGLKYLAVISNLDYQEAEFSFAEETFTSGQITFKVQAVSLSTGKVVGHKKVTAKNSSTLSFSFSSDGGWDKARLDKAKLEALEDLKKNARQELSESLDQLETDNEG
jgi:hypothetical protein